MSRVEMPAHRTSQRRGAVLVYVLVAMSVFTGISALAIDVGHVRLVKVELQGAADAAARAAAMQLQSGVAAARDAAVATAYSNLADGSPVVLDPTTDITFGIWADGTFTALTGSDQSGANAVRVQCVRSSARGTGVAPAFAAYLGIGSAEVSAQATASGTTTAAAGFIGYSGITAKNNAFFGGYNSSVTTSPNENIANTSVRVGTNSFINTKNNDRISGDAVLGPSATLSGPMVSGTTYYQSSALAPASLPAWSPQTNPNSVGQSYTVASNTTLPAGTYWFTSLTINANLTFAGPSTVYVNGPITIGGTLAPASGVPSDLQIYQYGNNTFGDSSSNGMIVNAAVLAPGCDFVAKNNVTFCGSAIFNSITTQNNADFFYDQALGATNGCMKVATVQ